jgi:hypothetical protein
MFGMFAGAAHDGAAKTILLKEEILLLIRDRFVIRHLQMKPLVW